MKKELEGIFLGNESDGVQAEEQYNSLDDEMKKEIEAIIYAGCMIVVKQIYDEFANLPKKELNLKEGK